MSMFQDNDYQWRETYFILLDESRRPALEAVRQAILDADAHLSLQSGAADDAGRFESLTILATDDNAALDLSYTSGEEVVEGMDQLIEDLGPWLSGPGSEGLVERLRSCKARIDVFHFERQDKQHTEPDDQFDDEILDPGSLFLVINALADLTGAIAVDPQSGTIINEMD